MPLVFQGNSHLPLQHWGLSWINLIVEVPGPLLNEQQHLSEVACQWTLPRLCELRNTAKNCKEGQSHTQMCCLSCINSFPLSAIKTSHKTQFIFLQYASLPSLGLVYTFKGCFLSGKQRWDSTCQTLYSPGTLLHTSSCQNVKLLIWAFSFLFLHSQTSIWKKSNYTVLFNIHFSLGSKFLGSHISAGVCF